MIREVRFSNCKATWYCCHKVVVHPNSSHGVMHRRINHHWRFIRVLINDFLIHLKQVAVFGFDDLLSEFLYKYRVVFVQSFYVCFFFAISLYGCSKVKKYCLACFVDPKALITSFFGCARGNITRNKVSKSGVATLEVIVSIFFC